MIKQDKVDDKTHNKECLKIGVLGTRGIPNAYGGFEQFAQYLSNGLTEKGHQVFVYNSSNHPFQEQTWNGINIIHCHDPENKIGSAGQFVYDYNCLKDARKRRFDVLLQLGYTSSSVWHRFWPGSATNIVNMDGLEWKRSKYNKLTQKFLRWAEKLAVSYADILVADSIGIKNYIKKNYQKEAIFIPYGAEVPHNFSESVLDKFQLEKNKYYLLIARMEPENNIEIIIQGHLQSLQQFPLIIVGNVKNKYGQFLSEKYKSPLIRFVGSIYDQNTINSLRYFSGLYFHGHSVGGTNPSLLEAMSCECNIAAHDNEFNRAILADDAFFFSSAQDIKNIINNAFEEAAIADRKKLNLEKIKKVYSWENVINDYETIFLQAKQSAIQRNI
jgi:glycosyltransferase involved in cell wall biosynthesis